MPLRTGAARRHSHRPLTRKPPPPTPPQIVVGYLKTAYYEETYTDHLMQKRIQILVEGSFLLLLLFLISFLSDDISTVGLILLGMAGTAISFALDTLYNHTEVSSLDSTRRRARWH